MDNKKTDDAQGFNDSELADIMSEIEDLEKDLEAQTVETINNSVVAKAQSPEMKEVLEEFVQESVDKVIPFSKKSPTVAPMKSEMPVGGQNSTMNFTVAGNMTINLAFNVSGQTINLTLDEAQGLVIEMHGGAKFCLPLTNDTKAKKAA